MAELLITKGREKRNKLRFGGNWFKQLELNNKCIICNAEKNLVVHHIDRNKMNNELNNFATLCRSCHSTLHNYFNSWNKIKGFEYLIK